MPINRLLATYQSLHHQPFDLHHLSLNVNCCFQHSIPVHFFFTFYLLGTSLSNQACLPQSIKLSVAGHQPFLMPQILIWTSKTRNDEALPYIWDCLHSGCYRDMRVESWSSQRASNLEMPWGHEQILSSCSSLHHRHARERCSKESILCSYDYSLAESYQESHLFFHYSIAETIQWISPWNRHVPAWNAPSFATNIAEVWSH